MRLHCKIQSSLTFKRTSAEPLNFSFLASVRPPLSNKTKHTSPSDTQLLVGYLSAAIDFPTQTIPNAYFVSKNFGNYIYVDRNTFVVSPKKCAEKNGNNRHTRFKKHIRNALTTRFSTMSFTNPVIDK